MDAEESCCEAFNDATAGLPEDAGATFFVTEDNVLMLTIAAIETDEGRAFLDQAVIFCPFCGTQLQDPDMIAAGKVSH